jgi:transposase
MFVHGARAVLLRVQYDTGGFGQWVHRLLVRAPRNKAIVAIAKQAGTNCRKKAFA